MLLIISKLPVRCEAADCLAKTELEKAEGEEEEESTLRRRRGAAGGREEGRNAAKAEEGKEG